MENKTAPCRICGGSSKFVFQHKVLGRHDVAYYRCDTCNFLETEEPYWLEEAYKDPITLGDTGLLGRNLGLRRATSLLLKKLGMANGVFLDYGGGYGVFTRLMRDVGFDFLWNDPYTENLFARRYEGGLDRRYDAITAFELFEHLPNPKAEMEKLMQYTDTVIFSTELRNDLVPDLDWNYYAFPHGQHIGFLDMRSLKELSRQLGVRVASDGSFIHMLTRLKRFPRNLRRFRGLPGFVRFQLLRKRMPSKTLSDSQSAYMKD